MTQQKQMPQRQPGQRPSNSKSKLLRYLTNVKSSQRDLGVILTSLLAELERQQTEILTLQARIAGLEEGDLT